MEMGWRWCSESDWDEIKIFNSGSKKNFEKGFSKRTHLIQMHSPNPSPPAHAYETAVHARRARTHPAHRHQLADKGLAMASNRENCMLGVW